MEWLLFPGALVPLVIVGVLLVGFLWPATRAMPVAWGSAVLVGYFLWNMPVAWLGAASLSGAMTAVEILWIVFGALVLLYTMMRAGAVDRINDGFVSISEDRRIQIVLLGFFLATFLEGVAGFGTPAAVVAPLLLALGFPALAAVVAALVGHAIATMFGAVGTPVVVGVTASLGSVEADLAARGLSVLEFTDLVIFWGALYQSLIGLFMPLVTVTVVVYFFRNKNQSLISSVRDVLPLCLFSGVAFVVPFFASAILIGPELPSIVGSMVGGGVVILALRAGYFVPASEWTFPDRSGWPDFWSGVIETGPDESLPEAPGSSLHEPAEPPEPEPSMSLLRAWAPYGILVVLLVVTRTVEPVAEALTQWEGFVLTWENIFATEIGEDVRWAYVPGTWLLVSALLVVPVFRLDLHEMLGAWREAGEKLVSPAVALLFVIAMVTIMLDSGLHPTAPEVGSMMVVLAEGTADFFGPAYPPVAALIGVLGTFITGSITVSNITFVAFQYEVATALSLPTHHVVAAQMVGASVGNTLAVHNVIAALATVGLVGQEGRVIRYNLLPVGYFVVAMAFLLWVGLRL